MIPFRLKEIWQILLVLFTIILITEVCSEGRIVCYYTNWSVYRPGTAKFNPQNINPYLCTHLVYAFGGFTKDNQMKAFDKYQDIEQGGYAKFTGLKTYNKQLKTMIAIGGWNEGSSRFSPLVSNPERRQQFIKNILKFLRQNHFDGIDLDWEYPAHREGGKARDRENYAQFVQELRTEFERESEKTGRSRLLITMAVPAGIEYIDKGYDVPKLNKYLDWFNVLTYDFHSSHEPSVNHHAPLYSFEEESEYNYDAELNVDYSIKYYLKAGADRDKLVLGIPTYGRSYTLINKDSTELGAPSEGPGEQGDATREKGYLAFYEICQSIKQDPEWTVVQPNMNVMGPYAYQRNQWVGYDDEAIVRKKAEYVVTHNLGGIMFWTIDNDDFRGLCNGKPFPLIEAAKEAMFEALGNGINEVAKSDSSQKGRSSQGHRNASNSRNRINSYNDGNSLQRKTNVRRPSITSRKPTSKLEPVTTPNNYKEVESSSYYIRGRISTPAPPTTPDPGSDFKCEEEGFFQHPRDCKKYYWCLDSGPSGLGIVAHQFTCPSGLYFNPAADSCDFARNVACKTKKSKATVPITITTTSTTTPPNHITSSTTRTPYVRATAPPKPKTETTSASKHFDDDIQNEEDNDDEDKINKIHDKFAEEDPKVIKELIELIRKVGGVEELEKHFLRKEDGSISFKENSNLGASTTPSTISKSLYDKVLSRPDMYNSFRNRVISKPILQNSDVTKSTTESTEIFKNDNSGLNKAGYSSFFYSNSRQGPQNEGLEKISEFDGFLKEKKQYVTINRNRSSAQGSDYSDSYDYKKNDDEDHYDSDDVELPETTKRSFTSASPSYTSLRRTRPTAIIPKNETAHKKDETNVVKGDKKQYATLNRHEKESGLSNTSYRRLLKSTTPLTPNEQTSDDDINENDDENIYDSEEEEDNQKYHTVQLKLPNISVQKARYVQNTRSYAIIGPKLTNATTVTPSLEIIETDNTESISEKPFYLAKKNMVENAKPILATQSTPISTAHSANIVTTTPVSQLIFIHPTAVPENQTSTKLPISPIPVTEIITNVSTIANRISDEKEDLFEKDLTIESSIVMNSLGTKPTVFLNKSHDNTSLPNFQRPNTNYKVPTKESKLISFAELRPETTTKVSAKTPTTAIKIKPINSFTTTGITDSIKTKESEVKNANLFNKTHYKYLRTRTKGSHTVINKNTASSNSYNLSYDSNYNPSLNISDGFSSDKSIDMKNNNKNNKYNPGGGKQQLANNRTVIDNIISTTTVNTTHAEPKNFTNSNLGTICNTTRCHTYPNNKVTLAETNTSNNFNPSVTNTSNENFKNDVNGVIIERRNLLQVNKNEVSQNEMSGIELPNQNFNKTTKFQCSNTICQNKNETFNSIDFVKSIYINNGTSSNSSKYNLVTEPILSGTGNLSIYDRYNSSKHGSSRNMIKINENVIKNNNNNTITRVFEDGYTNGTENILSTNVIVKADMAVPKNFSGKDNKKEVSNKNMAPKRKSQQATNSKQNQYNRVRSQSLRKYLHTPPTEIPKINQEKFKDFPVKIQFETFDDNEYEFMKKNLTTSRRPNERNRGSARFQSSELSSLLALDMPIRPVNENVEQYRFKVRRRLKQNL